MYSYSKIKDKREIEAMQKFGTLEVGMRVIAFSDDEQGKEKEVRGTIRFIGKWKDETDVSVGIELVRNFSSCHLLFYYNVMLANVMLGY